METVQLVIYNPVTAWISNPDLVRDVLCYDSFYYRQSFKRKVRVDYKKYLIDRKGYFFSGYIDRVKSQLKRKGIPYKLTRKYVIIKSKKAELTGVRFRKDQKWILERMLKKDRGVIKAPTGSGKTIIACGAISAYDTTVLVIVHTKSLYKDFLSELKKYFGDIGEINNSVFDCKDITIAMRQTLARRMSLGDVPDDFCYRWGMLIVDEVHHVSDFKGQYAQILSNIFAPIRYGITATLPEKSESRFAIEGLIGPEIGVITYKALKMEGILAKPKMKIIKAPACPISGRSYADVYESGIVNNTGRNKLIVKQAVKLVNKDKSVLIIVDRVEHGKLLKKMLHKEKPKTFIFLNGSTDIKKIEKEKHKLKEKKRIGVIATKIWNEGVNIPSLDAVIKADGGESEIKTIQTFGRGLRRTKDKTKVLFYDIIDIHHKWFLAHSMKRILTYIEMGWLK